MRYKILLISELIFGNRNRQELFISMIYDYRKLYFMYSLD